MIRTELPLPFVFYQNRMRQHRFRKNCAGQLVDGLLAPNDRLLPFQFRVESGTAPTVTSWELFDACNQVASEDPLTDENGVPLTDELGNVLTSGSTILSGTVAYDLTSQSGLISVVSHNGGYNLVYLGTALQAALACGIYEAKIVLSTGQVFWSELFRVVEYGRIAMPFVRISWSNSCHLERIVYPPGYRNEVYLQSPVAQSEPEIVEEVEPDGLGTEVVVFAKMVNKLRIADVVPDYLKTALSAMPVHKIVTIQEPGDTEIQVTRSAVVPTIEGNGCFSYVDILLEVDQPVYRGSCC